MIVLSASYSVFNGSRRYGTVVIPAVKKIPFSE
jgi:hypothetical protein